MSEKTKPYDDPSNWEYDGGDPNWTGDREKLSPYMQSVEDNLMKQAFPEGKEAFQKQQTAKKGE
jgi:hypothetical protein